MCLLHLCSLSSLLNVLFSSADTTSSSSCTPWESSENWWPFMLLCHSYAGLECTPWDSPTCITCPSTTTTASSSPCCPTSHVRSFFSPTLHFVINHVDENDLTKKVRSFVENTGQTVMLMVSYVIMATINMTSELLTLLMTDSNKSTWLNIVSDAIFLVCSPQKGFLVRIHLCIIHYMKF